MLGSSLASCRHDVRSPKLDRKVAPWSGFYFFFCFMIYFRSFCFCYVVFLFVHYHFQFCVCVFRYVIFFGGGIIQFYLCICFQTRLTLLNLVFDFHCFLLNYYRFSSLFHVHFYSLIIFLFFLHIFVCLRVFFLFVFLVVIHIQI